MYDYQPLRRPNGLIRHHLIWTAALFATLGFRADASSLRQTPMVRAVAAARPSVVNIHGKKTVRTDRDSLNPQSGYRQVNGMGTGVVVDERGYVITNHHVIEGVQRIQVTLADKRTVTARKIAHDQKTDLAIIKLDLDESLPVINVGTSRDLMPAEPVVAVGNAYGYKHTVTQGIISELGRTVQVSDDQIYQDLIQTDASINPGNSGGPLLNIDGEMIGINVAVRVGAQGIGFAIPVDQAMEVAARLLRRETSTSISHGVIGRTRISDDASQYVVDSVSRIGPAADIGLRSGDIITAVDELPVTRALDFERAMLGRRSGEKIVLSVSRGGESVELNMRVGDKDANGPSGTGNPIWDQLGLRLEAVSEKDFRTLNSTYHGGLRVVETRTDGPAKKEGIAHGDILVGMHIWETISRENVIYILNRPEVKKLDTFKFYILRDGSTLYGELRIPSVGTPTSSNIAARSK